jgi:hypothetical protein
MRKALRDSKTLRAWDCLEVFSIGKVGQDRTGEEWNKKP